MKTFTTEEKAEQVILKKASKDKWNIIDRITDVMYLKELKYTKRQKKNIERAKSLLINNL